MSRYRRIKPEFFVSEQVVSCSIPTRLLFIGLWSFADDAGIHPFSLKKIKMEIYPADDISSDLIKAMLGELIENKLIEIFEVDSIQYIHITGWHHQSIDRPTYRYPRHMECDILNTGSVCKHNKHSCKDSKSIRRVFDEYSTNDRRAVDDHSVTSKVKLNKVKLNKEKIDPTDLVEHTRRDMAQVFDHWQLVMGHEKAVLDEEKRKLIRKALKNGRTAEQLCQAITGCSYTPHNMGDNQQGQRYDGLHIIFRSENIDRFIKNFHSPPSITNASVTKKTAVIQAVEQWVLEGDGK